MARKIKAKAIVSITVEITDENAVKGKTTTETNQLLRDRAYEALVDALNMADLEPTIQRINLSRTEKDNTNE